MGFAGVFAVWRGVFFVASRFMNFSESLAEWGFLALAMAIVMTFGMYYRHRQARRRSPAPPPPVCLRSSERATPAPQRPPFRPIAPITQMIRPDEVYRLAMRQLRTSADVAAALGRPLQETELRAFVMSGGRLRVKARGGGAAPSPAAEG